MRGAKLLEAARLLLNKRPVDDLSRPLRLFFQNFLAQSLEEREVSAQPNLHEMFRDLRARSEQVQHILRMLESGHPHFRQRIHADNRGSAPCRPLQCRQHARMVRARILPNNKDGVGEVEVFELDRSFADSDHFFERHSRRLVAHVGAVRQIVGAELPHEELIEKRSFVAGAARSIKNSLVGSCQGVQFAPRSSQMRHPTKSVRSDRCPRRSTIG